MRRRRRQPGALRSELRADPELREPASQPSPEPLAHDPPRRLRGLDHVEVVGARELDQLHVVAGFTSGDGVRRALRRRDDIVPGAVHEQLRHAERQEPGRRGGGVPLGHLAGEPPSNASQAPPPRPAPAPATRSATPASETARLGRTAGAAPGAPAGSRSARGEPQRELTAGGVPDHGDPRRVGLLHRRERVDGGGRVQQGARPAAAFLADAPVLDVPGEEAVRQRGRARAASSASGPSPPARSRRAAARPPATARPRPRASAGSRPGRDGRRTGRPAPAAGFTPDSLHVCKASSSRQQSALERLEHPVDVLLDVVEVGRDAQAAVARGRDDPLGRELAHERVDVGRGDADERATLLLGPRRRDRARRARRARPAGGC